MAYQIAPIVLLKLLSDPDKAPRVVESVLPRQRKGM